MAQVDAEISISGMERCPHCDALLEVLVSEAFLDIYLDEEGYELKEVDN